MTSQETQATTHETTPLSPEVFAALKPSERGAGGDPTQEDVSGHSWPVRYSCWRCGACNTVPSHWSAFVCWRSGTFNRVW